MFHHFVGLTLKGLREVFGVCFAAYLRDDLLFIPLSLVSCPGLLWEEALGFIFFYPGTEQILTSSMSPIEPFEKVVKNVES